ncbi:MAG: cob(I)yrinic acid a,c-diamide adenosyltransferase [Minisyncoccota bacterium]
MLYTRKGDGGDTGTFGCNQRMSKSSAVAEALGTLDEINSFLGVCKMKEQEKLVQVNGESFEAILHNVQQNLFTVQAEVAGADKHITDEKVKDVEAIIADIEKELPPIKTFFVSGGTELAASLDFARTLARRAERRVVAVAEEGSVVISAPTRAFLNRLSSLLYAMARLANHVSGVKEEPPTYR